MKPSLLRLPTSTTLLGRLIEAPDLVRTVRGLPAQAFSALVRHVGVEDAGEIVALATTDQLVAAFDEDLFVNTSPGEREVFDDQRFVAWLEVLLEAGDEVAASRMAELSEDFVVQALSRIAVVLDYDALLTRMSEGGRSALRVDKALESSLAEEIDGYLLISRKHEGWDAVLALILALDRDHRPLLVRILDRCAAIAKEYVDDLDALATVLSAEDSLAEDVEAEREDRRRKLGYVEPRSARTFLALARRPLTAYVASEPRDPITRAHFRDLERRSSAIHDTWQGSARLVGLLGRAGEVDSLPLALPPGSRQEDASGDACMAFIAAMHLLKDEAPQRFGERMEELAYLANVLVAGATVDDRRFRPLEAAEAVLATVALGAELEAYERRPGKARGATRATAAQLCEVLRPCAADLLFRKASSTLTSGVAPAASAGFLRSRAELDRAIEHLGGKRPGSPRTRATAKNSRSRRY